MTAKYDIFKKTPQNDFVWVEAERISLPQRND
jgi:hypothetical protein